MLENCKKRETDIYNTKVKKYVIQNTTLKEVQEFPTVFECVKQITCQWPTACNKSSEHLGGGEGYLAPPYIDH